MRVDILSLFPGFFSGPFSQSLIARAIEKGLLEIVLHDIRDHATGRHAQVDDRPYGGGPGMVLMPEPLKKALDCAEKASKLKPKKIYLSPQGSLLSSKKCQELAQEERLILLCGHYEGIDQRIIDREIDEEISIGDYVLSNGCPAALVLVDAMARFIEGMIGNDEATKQDSFSEHGIYDWPHYTRPSSFEGMDVPEVLLSGHHEEIQKWRLEQAQKKTQKQRPELMPK